MRDEAGDSNRAAPDGFDSWNAYWTAQGMSWRTEPEIDAARQQYLTERRAIVPDVERAIYPFKDISPKLTRSDIEWLIVTHDGGRGPVIWEEERAKRSDDRRRGLDLRGADLRGLDLQGLPLVMLRAALQIPELSATPKDIFDTTRARLDAANLAGADLSGAYLAYATAEHADFRHARLDKANLSEAFARHADFSGAVLTNANLFKARLAHADLQAVDAQGAYFVSAALKKADFSKAQLQGAHFDNAELEGAFFLSANLRESHFYHAHLAGPKLFEGAVFRHADLSGANLMGAHLEFVYFANTKLEETVLTGAHLEAAEFEPGFGRDQTQLKRARLRGARLQGTVLGRLHMEGADLTEAHLEGAFLEGSYLGGADLRLAFLDAGTVLDDISLVSEAGEVALLADVRWRDANLAVVPWKGVPMVGDERQARSKREGSGKAKAAETRLREFQVAVRASRQLATALRGQGLNEDADKFAYRAQVLQRTVLRLQGRRLAFAGSWFLDFISGYGYEPLRSLATYVIVILGFAIAYRLLGNQVTPPLGPLDAIVFSVTSFHGRGFSPGEVVTLHNPVTVLAAIEAIIGLLIEITFIATFTQRFFAR